MRQKRRFALAGLYGSTWMVSLALTPYLLSQAVDRGLQPQQAGPLIAWSAAVFAMGLTNATLGILRHRTMTKLRLDAGMRTADLVTTHAARLGAALPRRVTAGEVVTIGIGDVWVIARAMTAAGPGIGAVVAYIVVAVLLFRTSPLLAVVVLAGVPVIALLVGPMLGRLQATGGDYREQEGALAARLVDILGGLRVLNGLGGKDTHAARFRRDSAELRESGYRVGTVTSWIGALGSGLPAVFLAVVVWLAARLAVTGDISAGDLVAVYGYVAVLAIPVLIFIEVGTGLARGMVAARRVITFLRLPEDPVEGAAPPDRPAALHDPVSGVTVAPGRFTALAGARTAEAAAVLDRLGRYGDTPATWGGRRLDGMARPAVRDRVLVADHDADLFAGPLREVVAGAAAPDEGAVRRAVHIAVAHDVAGGDLDRPVEWGGRNLSGGQRQRLRLARAVLADPEMLLAVEPTSAVDAHTEAAIAERLAAARAGRGTLIATTSPVLLDRADVVHYLVDERVAATGTHRELLVAHPGYRALVTRMAGDEA
ncbi:ABC transporter transmembrane domain-containing protein [Jidongwangia harbinensis]|uniref:ABC transporter transmembrane domain-containing protein n=1 Tax=Jidongwangia harbinensis TaxID=2878561 RepID=UPI001CD9F7C6|nr:ABC transporter ATP-binding protein [Jidongwangia harbinensis]MCA2211978.1 ABC transporter ATP-binding protein/permease [Jidongwangia harbinensis]